ncbi:DUF2269 domain-containing protein [Arthrobacter sp. B2a2-09]|nr:DUF2269 domain-containing protein [Arthrobacter sp. B2a2-09]MCZ9880195.1 DUF2269 domain-containing protein [Arthrobacter sp. B2a2-09]
MSPRLRKLALTAHVTFSLGWFGAVAAFLALAVAGLASTDAGLARAAYIGMGVTGWFAIVPFALASLITGIVSSLGTVWGLFRHYWVLIKLLITALATGVLLVHMGPISGLAATAAVKSMSAAGFQGLRIQVVVQAGLALLVLLLATALSVYKPRGLTGYGQRTQRRTPPAIDLNHTK